MTGARGRAVGRWAALGLAAILVIGCEQLDAAGVPVTPIHVVRETDALWVRAPAVASPEMLVVLCPTRPVSGGPLSEPGPARFELPATCHQYGRVASSDGLDTRLSFAELDAGEQAVFDGASEWWVVLVAVRGDSAGAVFETQVDGGPIEGGVNGSAPSSPTATDAPA